MVGGMRQQSSLNLTQRSDNDNLSEPTGELEIPEKNQHSVSGRLHPWSKRCQICKKMVPNHFKRHVLSCHLKKPIWCCPYCSYSSSRGQGRVYEHIGCYHADKEVSCLDRRSDYEKEISELMIRASQEKPGTDEQEAATESFPTVVPEAFPGENEMDKMIRPSASGWAARVKRKHPCEICKKFFWSYQFQRHVLVCHLKKPVWFCPYCDYSNVGFQAPVRYHILRWHPEKPVGYVDRRSDYAEEIKELMAEAFPHGADSESGLTGVYSSCRKESNDATIFHTVSRARKVDGSLSLGAKSNLNSSCRMCNWVVTIDTVWKRVAHVQAKHLKKKMYFCPLCAYSDFSKRKKLFRDHFEKVHPDKQLEIVDKSEEYRAEIEKMVLECFSKKKWVEGSFPQRATETLEKFAEIKQENDAEKLTGSEASGPGNREEKREFCKKCRRDIGGKSVERHVYHVHIRKLSVFCPHCDFGALYDREQVEFHIRAVHGDKDVQVVDKRGEMKEEFEMVKSELFS